MRKSSKNVGRDADNELFIEDISVEEELDLRSREARTLSKIPRKAPVSPVQKVRNGIMIALFALILLAGMVGGLLLPFRPTTSDLEKRALTPFPTFSWETFLNGEYLDQLQTWYSDSYPGREHMLRAYSEVQRYYGFKEEEFIGDPNAQGDPIPTAPLPTEPEHDPTKPTDPTAPTEDPGTQDPSTEPVTEPDGTSIEETQEPTPIPPTETPVPTAVPPTIPPHTEVTQAPAQEGEGQFGGIFVKGDTAYAMYYFSLDGANSYIAHVNNVANALDGTTNVYCMLLPTSCYFYMTPEMKAQYGVASESDAINYMYGSMNSKVHTVSVIPTLQNHINEYLFFRTDHHWTQLGAYYAYQEFANVKGIQAHSLDYYTPMAFPGFLGTFYSETQSARLAANPDTVYAYVPHGTNRITATDTNGQTINWPIINDVSTYNKYNKYATFICGDKPFSVITNPEINDGSACLVIKESFGNAFVPFMVDHYQYTYVIDYRYNNSDGLVTFCKTHNVNDLIYANVAELVTPSSAAKLNSMLY